MTFSQSSHLDSTSSFAAYRPEAIWDRLAEPSVRFGFIAAACAALISVVGWHFGPSQSLASIVWHVLVLVIPSRLVVALDPAPPTRLFTATPQAHFLHGRWNSTKFARKSDALRRILGLDQKGFVVSVTAAAKRRLTPESPGHRLNANQPPGLGNYDNSCFQNSVLQGLSTLDALPSYLATDDESEAEPESRIYTSFLTKAPNLSNSLLSPFVSLLPAPVATGSDRDTAKILGAFLRRLRDTSNNGKVLWTPNLLKSLNTSQQQDAQEYFSKLIHQVDGSLLQSHITATRQMQSLKIPEPQPARAIYSVAAAKTRTPASPLEGWLAQRVVCVHCRHSDGLSLTPFNCLTLTLPLDSSQVDLQALLDSYISVETIEGVECPKCTLTRASQLLDLMINQSPGFADAPNHSGGALAEPMSRMSAIQAALEDQDFEWNTVTSKCRVSARNRVATRKTKQIVIGRPPRCLALHISRSIYDELTGRVVKNQSQVKFPAILDLGPWCLGQNGKTEGRAECRADSQLDTHLQSPVDSQADSHVESWDDLQAEALVDSGLNSPLNTRIDTEVETWALDPYTSMAGGRTRPPLLYNLRAIITHTGRHENGHYVCFKDGAPLSAEESILKAQAPKLAPASNEDGWTAKAPWWRISDENVREVTAEEAMDWSSTGASMLFYEYALGDASFNLGAYQGHKWSPDEVATAESPSFEPTGSVSGDAKPGKLTQLPASAPAGTDGLVSIEVNKDVSAVEPASPSARISSALPDVGALDIAPLMDLLQKLKAHKSAAAGN